MALSSAREPDRRPENDRISPRAGYVLRFRAAHRWYQRRVAAMRTVATSLRLRTVTSSSSPSNSARGGARRDGRMRDDHVAARSLPTMMSRA